MAEPAQVMGWGQIFGILVLVGLTVGLLLGVIGEVAGLRFNGGAGVGAAIGATGALLIARRRLAVAARAGQKSG